MGKVKKMLHSSRLKTSAPMMYAGKRSLESAETLHMHERNIRLEYTREEFWAFVAAMEASRRPGLLGYSDHTVYLSLTDILPEPGISPDRFDVEESTYPTLPETTIHIHYRNLRLEFTHEEWQEFAQGIQLAWSNW